MVAQAPGRGENESRYSRWTLAVRTIAEVLAGFAALTLCGLLLGWVVVDLVAGSALAEADAAVVAWMESRRSAALDVVTNIGSAFSDTVNMVVLVVVVSAILAYRYRRWLEPVLPALALTLESSVFLAVSSVIGRARPPVEQLDPSPPTAAFPSGHAGAAVAFYAAIALIVHWNSDRLWLKYAAVLAAVVISIVVAVSRVYRGMHYPSDVLVGLLLGLASTAIAALIVLRAVSRRRAEGEGT